MPLSVDAIDNIWLGLRVAPQIVTGFHLKLFRRERFEYHPNIASYRNPPLRYRTIIQILNVLRPDCSYVTRQQLASIEQ